MAIMALIIALFAAAFTGYHVYLAFNEQKQRLRPHVYISKMDTKITDKALVFHIGMTNCGLLPARKTTISNELKFSGDVIKNLKPSATITHIVLPNQTIGQALRFGNPARSMILQGEVKLTAKIEIRYQGNGKNYYFISTFVYNLRNNKWTVVETDAD